MRRNSYITKQYIFKNELDYDYVKDFVWSSYQKADADFGINHPLTNKPFDAEILGYLIKDNKLTLYLKESVRTEKITENNRFTIGCIMVLVQLYIKNTLENGKSKAYYRNLPLDIWIESHKNWCIKLSHKLSNKYNMDTDVALSDIYYIVTKLYNQKKFINNLFYVQTSINNYQLGKCRASKNHYNDFNNSVSSIYETVKGDGENKEIELVSTIEDNNALLPEEEEIKRAMMRRIIRSLRDMLNEEEINDLMKIEKLSDLKRATYNKLSRWRNKNQYKEYIKGDK